MPYSPLLIKPFRDELVVTGVQELLTADDVDKAMDQPGTTLVIVNSVCGCAAGIARPAIKRLMDSQRNPDHVFSVFAGQDLEATARFRSYIADIPPSSPSFALFKDKELIFFIPKHRIESRDIDSLCSDLESAIQEYA